MLARVSSVDVALATCSSLPEVDLDMAPLLDALRSAGLTAEALAWDDPKADFAGASVTLLRSTWNYQDRPAEFVAWVERTAKETSLYNPAPVVRWNVHKSYLLDLERSGVPVVPTRLVKSGDPTTLAACGMECGWREVVVKPAVSAGSRRTMRVSEATMDRGEAHFRSLLATTDVLIQPYLPSVEGHGERAVVWIDGEPTHAVRKAPRFMGDAEAVSNAVGVDEDEAALARRAVAAAPGPVLYARIDVVRDDAGRPRVMELELIEPSLFFPQAPAALERYVAAVRVRVRGD
jgi:glutathione synthase/RimK-type ligase-like ATP-grasp enzyme